MATQQEVIKKFMESLDKTTLSGTEAVDEAIRACSDFNSMQEVIDKMVSDCRTVNNAKNFLLNYCGINLDNDDTGAITGWDAGGSVVKDAEDIVLETGELINFTGNSFIVKGLTLQLENDFSTLTDNQKYIWQGLYTWWVKGALDLIAESYGNNFGFDSNSSATIKKICVDFSDDDRSSMAWLTGVDGYGRFHLVINNNYFENIDINDPNGKSSNSNYSLDRVLAHELTHAVMQANIISWDFSTFIIEGMAELTHGTDDYRRSSILTLAGSPLTLENTFNGTNGFSDRYAAGYMLLRYLAKQAANEYGYVNNTISAINLAGTSEDEKIRNSGDSVTVYAGLGNDAISNTDGGNYSYIDLGAGDDYVYNTGDRVTIYGGFGNDTIKDDGSLNKIDGGLGNDLFVKIYGTIYGGAGNDTFLGWKYGGGGLLYGDDGDDLFIRAGGTIDGGAGDDSINVLDNDGSVNGGDGDDFIVVKYTNDTSQKYIETISGGKGSDTIDISNEKPVWRLYQYADGDGDDVIIGFSSLDTLEITSGTYITEKSGNDLIINVGKGSITLIDIYSSEYTKVHIKDVDGNINVLNDWSIMSGTSGADSIYNAENDITISGLGDNDTIENYGNKVSINGGEGDDSIQNSSAVSNVTVDAGVGNDYVSGGSLIRGGAGDDSIFGRGIIYGEDGDDYISGNNRRIQMTDGGSGNDTISAAIGFGSRYYYSSLIGGEGDDVFKLRLWEAEFASDSEAIINGGAGNDTIEIYNGGINKYLAKHKDGEAYRSIYQYTSGDGNDVIEGFTGYDKIEITGDSYSTITSGDDIIIKVGNGSIILKDAKANDIDLNIDGTFDSNTDWQTINNSNSNTIVYGGDYDETITNTASNVTIDAGGGNDSIDCANYSTKVIYNNSISAGNGNDTVHIYLTSLNAVDGGTGDDSIYAEINDDITINGGEGNDTIIAEGDNNAVIIGGDGDDKITVQGQGNQTIDAGKGNDTISGSASNRLYRYSKDDGNDVIFGYGASDSIQINGGTYKTKTSGNDVIIEVGNESITVKDVGSMNLNIIGEKEEEKPFWSINGTTAIYATNKSILVKVSGLKSNAPISGISLNGSVVTLSNSVLNQGTVSVSNGYTLKLGDDVIKSSTTEANWSVSGTTASYKANATSAGYSLSQDARTINYTNASGGNTLVTVSGLKSNAPTSGISLNGSVVTLSNSVLNQGTVTVSNGYTLKLGDDVAKSSTTEANWSISGTTATYKAKATSAGYSLSSDSQTINYTNASGGGTFTVTGLKNGLSVKNGTIEGISVKDSVVKVSSNIVGEGEVKITGGGYTLEIVKDTQIPDGLSIKNGILTVSNKFTEETINLNDDWGINVTKVDSASISRNIGITGNKNNNSIKGGKGADTICGGVGKNTLTGGTGRDVFVYAGGNDLITDYKSGEDQIKLNLADVTKSSVKGSDVILATDEGTLTIKGIKDKAVTFVDESGSTTDLIFFADTYYAPLEQGLTYDAKRTVLTASSKFTEKEIDLEKYLGTVTKVNASALSQDVNIVGNVNNNSIKGGKGFDTISGGIGNDTLSGGSGDDSIFGGDDNDKILGEAGNDTLIGGSGNDTLTGGAGKDIFVYERGNDLITDYKVGEDQIKLNLSDVTKTSVKGSDVILTTDEGTLTIKGTKDKVVTFVDESGSTTDLIFFANTYYEPLEQGLTYDAKRIVLTASNKFKGNEIDLEEYLETVTKVNASALSQGVNIVGNGNNNSIKGGKGSDTISGGIGKNTLTGGTGKDLFIYDGGNDVITDYKVGEDQIKLNLADVTNSSVKGSDVILKTDDGTLTIKGTKDKVVTFVDESGSTTDLIFFADTYYVPLEQGLTYDAKRTVLTASNKFKGEEIDLEEYLETVTKVNASALSQGVNIIGNGNNNSIKGGKGADTICGGNGNDTLTGGTGRDVFVYEDGNDVITDYKSGEDKIEISGKISGTSYKGKDVIFTVGSGALTVKGVKGKEISVTDSSGETQTYSKTLDLLYDNNLVADEFGIADVVDVTENNYSLGKIEYTSNSNDLSNNSIVSASYYDKK